MHKGGESTLAEGKKIEQRFSQSQCPYLQYLTYITGGHVSSGMRLKQNWCLTKFALYIMKYVLYITYKLQERSMNPRNTSITSNINALDSQTQ
jgi:hypothetical protein